MPYNVMLVSAVQLSESAVCIHISPYPLPLEARNGNKTPVNWIKPHIH